jgi:membrane protein YdbS with pleckstrin-like domain
VAVAPLWLAITVPAVTLVLALWRLVLIPRQVRAIGYAERDDDLLIRRGIFFQRTMVVPYGRMQYVDIAVGPVERSLGLCTPETPHGLGGNQRAPRGFPRQEGARLREQLSARGEARLAGL